MQKHASCLLLLSSLFLAQEAQAHDPSCCQYESMQSCPGSWSCSPCCSEQECCCGEEISQMGETSTLPVYDLCCDCGVFVSVDFLYWYARESNLTYAITYDFVPTGDGSNVTQVPKKYETFDTKWKPGVRVGLGMNLPCDGWDILAEWTYYKNSQKNSLSLPERSKPFFVGELYFGTPWARNETPATRRYNIANGEWKFRWNGLDLVMGRRYWLSPCFTLKPSVGIRGGWTKTNFDFVGLLTELQDPPDEVLNIDNTASFDNSFWGYGLLLGIDPAFYFTPCFSLYGGLDLSLLWGKSKLKEKHMEFASFTDTTTGAIQVVRNYNSSADSDVFSMQPILDLAIGLRYELKLCCDRYQIGVDVGWEHHVWLEHTMRHYQTDQSPLTSGEENQHDIEFGGFVLQARFDF